MEARTETRDWVFFVSPILVAVSIVLTAPSHSLIARLELPRIGWRLSRSSVHAVQHSGLAVRRCRHLRRHFCDLLRWKRLVSRCVPLTSCSTDDASIGTRKTSLSSRNCCSTSTELNTTRRSSSTPTTRSTRLRSTSWVSRGTRRRTRFTVRPVVVVVVESSLTRDVLRPRSEPRHWSDIDARTRLVPPLD